MRFLVFDNNDFTQVSEGDITKTLLDKIRNEEVWMFRVNNDGQFEEFHVSDKEFSIVEEYSESEDGEEDRKDVLTSLTLGTY